MARRDSNFDWGDLPPAERLLKLVPVLLGVLLVAYLAFYSYYTVEPHERAVVLRFGKFQSISEPGLHFCLPLADEVWKISVEEHGLRLPFATGGERPAQPAEESTLLMTGDLKAASVEWTIQWQVTEPDKFLFRFDDPEGEEEPVRVISTAAQTVMNRLVGDYSLDEVLTEKRGEVAEEAREATQEILDHFSCGISIRDLQMQRVIPPARVKPAFDKVNVSIQDRDRLESEANKERNKLIPAAYAKKDKLIREAEGDADRSRAEALGEIEALLARYRAYQRSPASTRRRLYLERMEEVLGQVEEKTIIDADLDQILPLLNLQSGETP